MGPELRDAVGPPEGAGHIPDKAIGHPNWAGRRRADRDNHNFGKAEPIAGGRRRQRDTKC